MPPICESTCFTLYVQILFYSIKEIYELFVCLFVIRIKVYLMQYKVVFSFARIRQGFEVYCHSLCCNNTHTCVLYICLSLVISFLPVGRSSNGQSFCFCVCLYLSLILILLINWNVSLHFLFFNLSFFILHSSWDSFLPCRLLCQRVHFSNSDRL